MVSDSNQLENVTDPKLTHYKRNIREKWLLEGLAPDTRADSILSADLTDYF